MNLPIYSNLKAKLESKGLDSTTSGQIAWFVCSVALSFAFCFLFIVFINALENTLNDFLVMLFNRPFDIVRFTAIFIFFSNLLYPYNIAPLVLGCIIVSISIFLNLHFWVINSLSITIFLLIFLIKKIKILGFFILYYFGIMFALNFWKLVYSLAR